MCYTTHFIDFPLVYFLSLPKATLNILSIQLPLSQESNLAALLAPRGVLWVASNSTK